MSMSSRHPLGQAVDEAREAKLRSEGQIDAYREMLTILEQKYMGPGRPDRGTPEAKAILELAADMAEILREKIKKGA